MQKLTKEEVRNKIESATGKRIAIYKNRGSMKHYTSFRVKGKITHANSAHFDIDHAWGTEFRKQFPGAFFSNGNCFDIPNRYFSD